MTDSILNTIKKMLGISTTDSAFDMDIIVNINSAFMVLHQLGVGPELAPYSIEDNTSTWADFLTDSVYYSAVKTYVYLKVKQVFDPPGTSFHGDAIARQISEWEWRLAAQVPYLPEPEEPTP